MGYLYDGICLKNGRETNMDSLLLFERWVGASPLMLAVVCDGVGSLTDGAFASTQSTKRLSQWFSGLDGTERLGLRLRDEVLMINRAIKAESEERALNTATTLSALLLEGSRYYIVHAGDSRIYSVGSGGLVQLTIDAVSETGKLTSYIGRRDDPSLHYGEGTWEGGVYLLCSDGLNKRVDDGWIYRNVNTSNRRTLRKSLKILSGHAIEQDERDNISIAIVKIAV